MICPVCRSQNMETAKFCGNCGSPFPRSSQPSASLLNCPQGHVYSAVYEHCPYCPQPERSVTPADFATRVETPLETEIESPRATPSADFATRVEVPPETEVEPPAQSASARTEKMRRDYATLIDPGAGATVMDPITSSPTAAPSPAPPRVPTPASSAPPPSSPRANASPEPVPSAPPPPPPPEVMKPPAQPPAPPAAQDPAAKSRAGRRTLVVPEEELPPAAVPKGRLVGWLVAFDRNPDGQDYRLRAGRNVLGANPSCDIIVDDEAVSGVHASIVYRNGRCLIKDELSSNGTFVNGVEIEEPRALQSYDQIRIGNTTLTFVSLERPA
jgi:hypothetical protein